MSEVGIVSADLDARLLVCAAANIDHAGLIRDSSRPLGVSAAHRLAGFAARRAQREPVSRILGRREFWSLPFDISPAVLDPRPETEGLVGSVVEAIGLGRRVGLGLLDLGVGSGAILGALLKELPEAWGVGVDSSFEACLVARANLFRIGLGHRASIVCADWTNALQARFDVVVSNPPYVASVDIAALDPDVRDHDPIAALDGGRDGLDAYRAIVPCLTTVLRPSGIAAFECGSGQGTALFTMMEEAGLSAVAIYHDLAGHSRVVIGQMPG